MADDDKRGYGLVQPPAAATYQEDDPEHGMDMAEKMAFRKQMAAQQPKTAADMPLMVVPERSEGLPSRRALTEADRAEMGTFGPPRPTPAQMTRDNIFAPKAAVDMGSKIGKALHDVKALAPLRDAGGQAVHAYAQYMSPERAAVRSQSIPEPIKRAEDALLGTQRPNPQDEELKAIQEKVRAIKEATDKAKGIRQPIQQSREFSSNPAGQADQDEYITKIRQAMKNAVTASQPDAAARVPRTAEVQTPKSMDLSTDPGMSGDRAVQRNKYRPAASSLSPSGGYPRQEKPEDIAAREAEHLRRYRKQ